MANLTFLQRRRNKQKLSLEGNCKENIVTIEPKRGFIHNLSKFLLAWQYIEEGKYFITDCKYHNNKTSDLFVLDDSITYNIIYHDSVPNDLEAVNVSAYPVKVQILSAKKIVEDGLKRFLPSTWGISPAKKKKKKK